jgi:LPS sulfotransferase NodH
VTGVSDVEPPFNFDAIHSLVELSVWADQDWQTYFERNAIDPLVLTYEELAEAPEVAVRRVIAHLGLPPPERVPSETWRHQRQADALTDAWVARYRSCAERRSCPPADAQERISTR